jgi:hypothetical protein
MRSVSIQLQPPPGCRPISANVGPKPACGPATMNVAGQGDVHPRADRRTVDGSDRGDREVADAEERRVDLHEVVAHLLGRPVEVAEEIGEVGPGAEALAGTCDDQGSRIGIVRDLPHGLRELVEQRPVERVASFGRVEGEQADGTVGVEQHE